MSFLKKPAQFLLGSREDAGVLGTGQFKPGALRFGGEQADLVKTLQSRIQGEKPSIAEEQLKRGLTENLGQTLSALRSTPGVATGVKARTIASLGSKLGMDVAEKAGLMRAQEQTQAERSLANLIAGAQGADVAKMGVAQKGFADAAKKRQELLKGIGSAFGMGGMGGAKPPVG